MIMENQIQLFQNEELGKMRVVNIDGQPWFVGKDIADILGYEAERNAIKLHVDEEDKLTHQISASGQNRNMVVINESGLYALIISSKLPKAKLFKRWVTSEILPSIRKHGAYITENTLDKMLENPDFAIRLFMELKQEKEKNKLLAPKARYYDLILQSKNSVQVSLIAKDYGMSAVAFNTLLHDLSIQYKVGNTWVLYQAHANKGYTVSRTYPVHENLSVMHTYWTQRGRLFLYENLKIDGIVPLMESENATLKV